MDKVHAAWATAAVFFIALLLIASIVIVVLALETGDADLPETIDVVLLDRGRDRERGMANAVLKYMDWVNNIYVLSSDHSGVQNGLTYVSFSGTQAEAFNFIPEIPGISAHAIFLSDQTIPCRRVHKTYLFNMERPRAFNVLESQAYVQQFATVREALEPVMVADVENIRKSELTGGETNDYVLRTAVTDIISVNNSMKRDLFLYSTVSDWSAIADGQIESLEEEPPLFATFHITGRYSSELNHKVVNFLNTIEV